MRIWTRSSSDSASCVFWPAKTSIRLMPMARRPYQQRLPEETPFTLGTWVTGFGSGMHINDQASRAFDQNTGGFQLGADRRFEAFHGDLYIGGFLSYFNASRDFLDGGNGSTNALSLGAYTTWMNPKGWYADLVLKYTQFWNYFNTPASDGSTSTGDYSIPSLGGSLEIGKRFDLGKFFIEPQAQLAGVWEAGNDYSATNGLMVSGSDQYSLQGRLGLRVGMHFALNNRIELEPYLKVSGVHEFLTGDRVTLNETGFNPTLSGTLLDAAVGLTAKVSQSVYLYGGYRLTPTATGYGNRGLSMLVSGGDGAVSQKRRWRLKTIGEAVYWQGRGKSG